MQLWAGAGDLKLKLARIFFQIKRRKCTVLLFVIRMINKQPTSWKANQEPDQKCWIWSQLCWNAKENCPYCTGALSFKSLSWLSKLLCQSLPAWLWTSSYCSYEGSGSEQTDA